MEILSKIKPIKLFVVLFLALLFGIPIFGWALERFGNGFLMLDTNSPTVGHTEGPTAWFLISAFLVIPFGVISMAVFLAVRKLSYGTRNLITIASLFIYVLLLLLWGNI